MDCKTARLLLDFARPHAPEVETDDAAALDRHLPDPRLADLKQEVARQDMEGFRQSDVADVFRRQGVEAVLPADLQYKYLNGPPNMARLPGWPDGPQVPHLTFVYTEAHKRNEG